ncbi:MAG TPA: cytochrome c oxidase assembly protein [Solirubrobacteraceae bacterium]|jgi:cytochrome c oxidase assembly factor CtaG|nr:cytochrome c oxidase assembly protein [Solirubrobacteraceae bacterium]
MDWTAWSLDPSLIYVIPAGILYWLGGRRHYRTAHGEPWRAVAFAAGLATIVLALDSPIDELADQLFWVHMIQHILLLTVAPPLILLGRPWPRMWRALPMPVRVGAGRRIARASWTAPLRKLARPIPAWLLFNATIVVWHLPGAYNLTLTDQTVHNCEHAMFFFAGLMFWAHAVSPGPLRPRLHLVARVAYLVGAMIVGWVLAIVLVVVQHPLYGHYAALAHRPGGISALTDQQIAGGMMWVPGSISYTVAAFLVFWRWLEPDRLAPSQAVAPADPVGPRPWPSSPDPFEPAQDLPDPVPPAVITT